MLYLFKLNGKIELGNRANCLLLKQPTFQEKQSYWYWNLENSKIRNKIYSLKLLIKPVAIRAMLWYISVIITLPQGLPEAGSWPREQLEGPLRGAAEQEVGGEEKQAPGGGEGGGDWRALCHALPADQHQSLGQVREKSCNVVLRRGLRTVSCLESGIEIYKFP